MSATTWEAFLLEVEAFGVLECTQAGLGVARYRVVERWVGSIEESQEFAVAAPGLHLVGERRLMALGEPWSDARKRAEVFGLGDSVVGLHTPWSWRDHAVEFETPYYRDQVRLPLAPDPEARSRPFARFASDHGDLESFRADVQALLSAPAEEQERLVILSFAVKILSPAQGRGDPALLKRVEASSGDLDAMLALLWEARRFEIVAKGRERALALLQEEQWGREALRIRLRLGLEEPEPARRRAIKALEPLEPEALQRLLQQLATVSPSGNFELTRALASNPLAVAEALKSRLFGKHGDPYWLASFVCFKASDPRPVLDALAEAEDPWLRVAAAVYLGFSDAEASQASLRELQELPGGPGAWAALTLARRGDPAALPRAIQALSHGADPNVGRAQLRLRLQALLSNAAAASETPPPPRLAKTASDDDTAQLLAWFEQHREALTQVRDPWLDELNEQKVD